ncbi:MAG TPA: hypothetical protein VK901_20445, partial [Nitrospiraceae bacterium]|nr:hypothetical protein [Nitrospiraceae bacterium]
ANDGDISGSLAAASHIEGELSRARAYRNIAAVQTEDGHRGQGALGINTRTSSVEPAAAQRGVVG